MLKFLVAAALCASSGAWAQEVTLDFQSGVFGTGKTSPSLVYEQDGFTLRSESKPLFDGSEQTWGNAWSGGSGVLFAHATAGVNADFTLTNGGDLFRYIAVDVKSTTFDFCIWQNTLGGPGTGDGPSIGGYLGGVLQFSTSARATSCTSFVTVFSGNANAAIDSLTFSVPGLSFIQIDNLSIATTVPEPSTWALVGVGALALIFWRTKTESPGRTRRRNAATRPDGARNGAGLDCGVLCRN